MSAYLDHNAGAPIRPEAADAAARAMAWGGNPSSPHGRGRRARQIIEEAREEVAALVHGAHENVIFTSGGTEANHLALGLAHEAGLDAVLLSAIEHPSLLEAAKASGLQLYYLEPDSSGQISVDAVSHALERIGKPVFLSIMLANNETGVIAPIAEIAEKIAEKIHEAGGLFHSDATQAPGRIPIDMKALGVDALSLSGHKMGAPSGVGALILRDDFALKPLWLGGGQERGLRAGTENLSGIAGFGAAAACAAKAEDAPRLLRLRDDLEKTLKNLFPDAVVFSENAPRLPNTSAFALQGISSQAALIRFDLEGVCLSSGAACSSGKVAPSHVLHAMGVPAPLASSALRASLGWNSQREDILSFEKALAKMKHAPSAASRAAASRVASAPSREASL